MHVDDAARSIVQALALPADHAFAYNIAGGSYLTERQLAELVRELLPQLTIEEGPPAWREGHLGPLVLDAAERDLSDAPAVDMRKGLAEPVTHSTALHGAARS